MRVFSSLIIFLLLNVSSTAVFAQSMILSTSNEDFEVTNVFSDVDEFESVSYTHLTLPTIYSV